MTITSEAWCNALKNRQKIVKNPYRTALYLSKIDDSARFARNDNGFRCEPACGSLRQVAAPCRGLSHQDQGVRTT
jgi:hypothetical protein